MQLEYKLSVIAEIAEKIIRVLQVNIKLFGNLPDGRKVHRIILSGNGLSVNILNYGAIVQDLR